MSRKPSAPSNRTDASIDWHSDPLTPQTVITDSYRNTQNVRRFFKAQIGPDFKFNRPFMAWLKENSGLTLGDAVVAYRRFI